MERISKLSSAQTWLTVAKVSNGEGVEDGLRAAVGVVAGVGEDLLEGWAGIVEGGESCVGNDEGFEDVKLGGLGEEGSDNVY